MEQGFYDAPRMANDSPRARYQNALVAARQKLMAEGLRAKSPVFLASIDADFDEDQQKPAAICEAFGDVASHRLAQKTHRLANDEEIDRFYREQKAREMECSQVEQIARERDGRASSPRDIANAITDAIRATQIQTEPAAPVPSGHTGKKGTEKEK